MVLFACAGSESMASKHLADQGIEITKATLGSWKRGRFAERYERIRREHQQKLEEAIVPELREVAFLASSTERRLLEAVNERLDNGEENDPGRALANVAKAQGTATDKLLALTGRPQVITEHRNPDEIARSLVARGVLKLVESTDDKDAA